MGKREKENRRFIRSGMGNSQDRERRYSTTERIDYIECTF